MGFFADLFTARTYTCESCQALKHTIAVQSEEIDLLVRLLDEEREKTRPPAPNSVIKPEFQSNIRKSRVPWSRKQAELESASAREAREQEKALWKQRVQAIETEKPGA